MNCNVIKDLLPLYEENLCSDESRKLVEEHLKNCNECREYQESISQEVSVPKIDEKCVQQFLSEKDLLSTSKKNIRDSFLKKSIFVTNIVSIAFTLFIIFAGALFMLCEYPLKFPKLNTAASSGFGYLIAFMAALFPLFIGLIGIIRVKRGKIKYPVFSFAGNILLQIPAIILSLIITVCIFIIMPPFESRTQNADNYLTVDKNLLPYEEVYKNFFPDKIPVQATEIEYFYSQYEAFFSNTAKMQASWKLPESEYTLAKKNIMDNTDFEFISKESNILNVTLKKIHYPGKVTLTFQFDDKNNCVIYTLYIDRKI